MKIKDRIKELRRVKGSDLLPNPKNWRTHPVHQENAIRSVLAEIAFADVAIARETEKGLMLIDGHLRAEVASDTEIPVVIVDLNDEEADKVLATLDPISTMAEADSDILENLIAGADFSEDLQDLLNSIIDRQEIPDAPDSFDSFDDDLETQYKCPKCGYEWG